MAVVSLKISQAVAAIVVVVVVAASCADSKADSDTSGSSPIAAPTTELASTLPTTTQVTTSTRIPESGPTMGGTLRYALVSDGAGFDTTSALHPETSRVIAAMSDNLMGLDVDGRAVPNLAAAMEHNDDATVWAIELRPDVRFHDGEPVDATAVVSNLEAQLASPVLGFAYDRVDQIVAVDDLRVEISMNRPWSAFDHMLVGQAGTMVSPATIGDNTTFVGTGPFLLADWSVGEAITVVRNPDYWRADEGLPRVDEITFVAIPDETSRRIALENGEVDVITSVNPETRRDIEAAGSMQVDINSTGEGPETSIVLNTTRAPTNDLRVRRALAHAIDRGLLRDEFRLGFSEVANGPFAPGNRFRVDTAYPEFDPEIASALIAEYEGELGPVELTLHSINTAEFIDTAAVIGSFWADIGVDVTVEPIGLGTEVTRAAIDDFQALTWYQFSDVEPDTDYPFFHSSGGVLNWSNLADAEIDAALDTGRESTDEGVRAEAYAVFQRELASELPFLWLEHVFLADAVISRPEVRELTGGVLPDGQPQATLSFGVYHGFASAWLD